MANLSKTIQQQIQGIPEDTSFGYGELTIPAQQYPSAAKVLERLQQKGLIRKLSKGIFYKPKTTVFGEKRPGEEQVLKPYLYREGQRIAYITGTYLYNQMGLTTQVPAVIQIASRERRIFVNRGTVHATAVKSYVDVTEDNYQLLGLLDVLKDLKDIPDVYMQAAIGIIIDQIQQLIESKLKEIVGYALKYPPRVRALLGAVLSSIGKGAIAKALKESLNPLTVFKLGINDTLLPSAAEWNIQ
jgi:hypothetical protein